MAKTAAQKHDVIYSTLAVGWVGIDRMPFLRLAARPTIKIGYYEAPLR